VPAIFPRWTNNIPLAVGVLAPLLGAFLIFGIWYWFSPMYTDVGYRPQLSPGHMAVLPSAMSKR
jgi:hypothetical protein